MIASLFAELAGAGLIHLCVAGSQPIATDRDRLLDDGVFVLSYVRDGEAEPLRLEAVCGRPMDEGEQEAVTARHRRLESTVLPGVAAALGLELAGDRPRIVWPAAGRDLRSLLNEGSRLPRPAARAIGAALAAAIATLHAEGLTHGVLIPELVRVDEAGRRSRVVLTGGGAGSVGAAAR